MSVPTLVVTLIAVAASTLVAVRFMRKAGVRADAPTTWAGRLPYLVIALGLIVIGGVLLSGRR